jgi:hypothetical protein
VDDLADTGGGHAAGLIANAQEEKLSGVERQAIIIMGEGIGARKAGLRFGATADAGPTSGRFRAQFGFAKFTPLLT